MPKKKRLIKAEDLYDIHLIKNPRLSPDGQMVVFSQDRVERKTEKKFANLWIAPTDAKNPPGQFTYGNQSDTQPAWSPDGSQIAFLSNREDAEKPAQIYLIPLCGGEARKLTNIKGDIKSLNWSPDGKTLLLTVQKTDKVALERESDEQKKKLGVVFRHYTRPFFKYDGYGYLPQERTHIWTVDVSTGKAKQLTDHPVQDQVSPTWSPDGKWIAYVSNVTDEPDFHPDSADLFIIPAKGGEPRMIPTPIGDISHPSFSPDGKLIAYYGYEGEGDWYQNYDIWIVPADGSAASCDLTKPYDLNADADTINDLPALEKMPPTWSKDGQMIYFPASLHGSTVLMSVPAAGGKPEMVIGEGGVVGSFTFDREQSHLAYFYGKIDNPGQIYVRDMAGKTQDARCLTAVNQPLLDQVELPEVEEVWFKGPAGNDLQGWIITPPGFDPGKKYPSIMEIHGGPITQYGKYFMHEFYYFAARGYVVYFCNPRGGRGYGEKHTQAIWGNWGEADYADLMAWADYMEKKPYIDKTRMGVTGGSYGGYMTVWIIGHTTRFKAAVTQRCVSNFISEWGSSDVNWTFEMELNKKPPYQDLQYYWDHSPIAYIGNAKTPTLVIHNENDHRCPIEQGEQVFVALRRQGVPSEMVRFPDEPHGLSRHGRTDRRIERLNRIIGWFDRYL